MTRKTTFFERSSWFLVNYLGLALGIALKSYTSVAKRLKLKVRKCWGLIRTFVEVTGEGLVGLGGEKGFFKKISETFSEQLFFRNTTMN